MVQKDDHKKGDHVEGAVYFCFERAAYVVLGEETIEGVGVVGRGQVEVAADRKGLLSRCDEDVVEVLSDESAKGKK